MYIISDGLWYDSEYLFIAFTCCPKWPEIVKELFPGQIPQDPHELIVRVFHQKLCLVFQLIMKGNIVDALLTNMYNIKWQKRGLPHSHYLVCLVDKLRTSDINSVISAEISDAVVIPGLYEIIRNHIIHDGKCCLRISWQFLNETQSDREGCPPTTFWRWSLSNDIYFTCQQNSCFEQPMCLPYNYLLCNILMSTPIINTGTVCWVYLQICKEKKWPNFHHEMNDHDEDKKYKTGGYISNNAAILKMHNFFIHTRHPPIIHLSFNLEIGQRIYFTEINVTDIAANPHSTTLITFFKLGQTDNLARRHLYDEVTTYYIWDTKYRTV